MSDIIIAAIIAVLGVLIGIVSNHVLAAKNAKLMFRHSQFQVIFSARTKAYTAFLDQYVLWCRSDKTPADTSLLLESIYSAKIVASSVLYDILMDIVACILAPDSASSSLSSLVAEFTLEANKELTAIKDDTDGL